MHSSPLLLALFTLLGIVAGSFGNVLLYRLPRAESIRGRSHCPHCGRILRALELIPIVSFLLLRRRCRRCRNSIAWRYPVVEAVSGCLFLVAALLHPENIVAALLLALSLWLLFLIAVTDSETQMIPDALSIPLILMTLAYAIAIDALTPAGPMIGILFFGGQWAVSRGKWVGSGDILLAVSIGLLLGRWELIVLAIAIAYIVGALLASVLLLQGSVKRGQHLAFGPLLVLGAFIVVLFGREILGVFGG